MRADGEQSAAVRAAAGHRVGSLRRGEAEGVGELVAAAQRVRQPGRERVAGPVRVDDRSRDRRRPEAAAAQLALVAAAVIALGRYDEPRGRREVAGLVALALVVGAPHEDVELNTRLP